MVNFTPMPLYPKKNPLYSLNRRLGGPQSLSIRFELEKNLLPSTGIRTPDRPACGLVAIAITLYRLLRAANWYLF
jgi:hypothetical protein